MENNEELKVLSYDMEKLFRSQSFFLDAKSEELSEIEKILRQAIEIDNIIKSTIK